MGATSEMIITEFEYKNEVSPFTMFTINHEILAIEHEGYDVSLMDIDDSEVTEVSEFKIMNCTDPEDLINEHFKSK